MAILQQGQQYMGGTVQFDSATGKPLAQGQTTVSNDSLPTTPTSSAITPSALDSRAQPYRPVTSQPYTPLSTPELIQQPIDTNAPLPQETAIYKMMQDLQGETQTLGSEEAFKQQQDTKFGVTEKLGVVNSLKNQFDALTREAQTLKLQQQQNIQNIQNSAQQGGANVTRGGLSPQERASQTQTNQKLLTLDIQQNNIASQHALASGDLATALSLADRALKTEYQYNKDRLDAKRANIELLLKDPTLSYAIKKRAEEEKKKNDEDQAKLTAETKNKETIQGLILAALQNGAPPALINKATQDGTIFGTASILSGYTAKETAQSIQEYQFAKKNGYTGSFSDYQNEDANRKIAVAKAGVAKTATGLPSNIASQVDKLSAAFDSSPIVKNYNEVQNKKLSVDSILQSGIKGPADLALVYEFMKALDPTSVVRETEYSTAAASGNIFSGMYAKYNGYLTEGGGFLPEQVKKDFQTIINKKFDVANSQYANLRKEQARKIDMKTGSNDGADYLTDYGAAVPQGNKQQTETPLDINAWLSKPDYNADIQQAKDAIANGADPVAVKARLQQKYKNVTL